MYIETSQTSHIRIVDSITLEMTFKGNTFHKFV